MYLAQTLKHGDNTGRVLWLTDHSEQSMQQEIRNLPKLKVQEREEAAWAIRNWHCGLELKGWGTALGLGVRSFTYTRHFSLTKFLS